jgi:4-hydroxy-3-polyprenylbenzoate decarboxylase
MIRRLNATVKESASVCPEDMQTFLAQLEQCGQLQRIGDALSVELEIAAVVDRVCKSEQGNLALLFEDVIGYSMPLAANLFGSEQRMSIALGGERIDDLQQRLATDLALSCEASDAILARLCAEPRVQPCVVTEDRESFVDLTAQGLASLPALRCWPRDGGRYITLGQVFSRAPERDEQNCGMYRLQLVDSHTALLRCHPGSGAHAHLRAWNQRGEPMPVAIALGGPPALSWAASLPLPQECREEAFLGYLLGNPIAMQHCSAGELVVPARAEIVIEGLVSPGETMLEGPFGNHSGRYAPAADAAVVRINSVRIRQDAIYPCTVVGPPPMENVVMASVAQRLLLPLLRHDNPWVIDVAIPGETIYHRAALVTVAAACSLSREEIADRLRSSCLLKGSRLLLLFDAEVSLVDRDQLFWRAVNAERWPSLVQGNGQQLLIDCRDLGTTERVEADADTLTRLRPLWEKLGLRRN